MLYRRFYAFAMSVSLRYAPNRDDALEILNDGFMKVFENICAYDQERSFKSWFRKILVNTALDKYRAGRKYLTDTGTDGVEVAGEPELSRWMEVEEILLLLSGLPQLYRLIFNLYEVEGYSHDEIAGLLDIAPGTSRSHLSRAKLMLRKSYIEKLNKPYNEAI
ncbi:MAG: RNA polymerase sigma factor [Bacteroidales bacterium]